MLSSLKLIVLAWLGFGAESSSLHITPTVTLVPRAQAVRQILEGASKFFLREVELSPAELAELKTRVRWTPEEKTVRFFIGRDAGQAEVGSVVLIKVDSRHGPLALAVGFDRQGTVSKVIVTHTTEETVPWVKKVLDAELLDKFSGKTEATVVSAFDEVKDQVRAMPRYMGQVITRGVRRAAALHAVAYAL